MHVWRVADGLPSDSVTAILQTRDGFIWIGTDSGLVRFDGVKFVPLPLAASATNNTVHVTSLCEDSRGYLWIGTQQDGLFEAAGGRLNHFTKEQKLLDDEITSLAADRRGFVWIGTKLGLNLWNGEYFKSFTARDGLPDAFVSGVNVARSGAVWITTHAGMCRFINGHIAPYIFQTESEGRRPEYLGAYEDTRGNLWAFGDTYLINLAEGQRFNYFRSSGSASIRIWSLCEGADGRLWIGTSGRGLFCFEDNRFQPVILDKDRWPYDVRAIYEDNEGDLWLGTSGGGLIQLRPQSVFVLRAQPGLPATLTTSLASDVHGRIYIGLQRGGLYAGDSAGFDPVQTDAGSAIQNYVLSLCVTPNGAIWAGTLGGGLYGLRNGSQIHLTTADGLADNTISAMCSDGNTGIWFSAGTGVLYHFAGNGLTRFGADAGLPQATVTALLRSVSGTLWLGTQDGQILRQQDGKFINLDASGSLGHDAVLALCEREPGQLWVGTSGGGLSCIASGSGISWTSANGLPSDTVAGIVEDYSKNLWLATSAGIYRVNASDIRKSLDNGSIPLACELMSKDRTLPDPPAISCGKRALAAPGGDLWFATSDGVLSVDPHNSGTGQPAFPIYIESAVINGRPIPLLNGAIWSVTPSNSVPFVTGDLRSLVIYFTALNFAAPEDVEFRHKLEGNDSDWVYDGSTRSIPYGRLPYGHYRFRLQARALDGPWQDAAQSFNFVVPTPIYFQTWILYTYGLFAVALIAVIVRVASHRRLRFKLSRLEQQQSLERERMRIARDMHDEIGSKLTKISFLSEHAQVEVKPGEPLAKKIDSIAETSRELLQTMDEIVWVVNPRNDTLENLTTYLAHYAVEYFQNTPVECELRLPQDIPRYSLSSETRHNLFLAFEEALNNVLKHSRAAKVKVEMALSAHDFALKIIDDGKGFDVAAMATTKIRVRGGSGGNGLQNMQQRLATIGGECVITNNPASGTTIILRFPVNLKKTER